MTKHTDTKAVAGMMPDELNALKAVVNDFMGKITAIDHEIETLKDDRKEVIEEFSDKLDMKTLQLALKAIKIENSVTHRDAFDLFMAALTDPAT